MTNKALKLNQLSEHEQKLGSILKISINFHFLYFA